MNKLTLDEWVQQHCPSLPNDIRIHLEETVSQLPEDLEAAIRCILTSVRQAFQDQLYQQNL